MTHPTPHTPRPASPVHATRELPNRRYYDVSDVAWLTGLPERVVRENIALSRTR